MKITRANKKDFPELARIIKEEFSKPPFNNKWTLENAIKTLENYEKKDRKIYKASINKEIVGLIIFREDYSSEKKYVYIEELVVKESFQKKGIGRALVEKVESYSRKVNAKYIWFSTYKRSSAVKFYKKLNYTQDDKIVFMSKRLK